MPMQMIGGTLCMTGSGKNRPFIVAQNFQARSDIGSMALPCNLKFIGYFTGRFFKCQPCIPIFKVALRLQRVA